MIGEIQTAFGILKLVPDAIQVGKDIWEKLRPPKQIESTDYKEGIADSTFYSEGNKFAISIPDDEWEFWRPSAQFLASMGAVFAVPTRSMPIIILSKQMIKLFRPNVTVTTEAVGQYTNIDEMIQVTKMMLQSSGKTIDDKDIYIENDKQSGQIVSSQPYLNDILYQVQNCYLHDGIFYTITASYVPMSSYSSKLFGGLQEIMNSFTILKTD